MLKLNVHYKNYKYVYFFFKARKLFFKNFRNDLELSLLKRNKLFFQDFTLALKFFFNFHKNLKLKKHGLNLLLKNSFFFSDRKDINLKEKDIHFFFISEEKDKWFGMLFDILLKGCKGFHLRWNSSTFFFIFKKKREEYKEFFPIFIVSPLLLTNQSFLSSISLFENCPFFVYLELSKLFYLKNIGSFKNNLYPLFFEKKNVVNNIFFWFKFLRKVL